MSSAKLKLGIYYFRKSVSRFSENNKMGGILKRSLGMAPRASAMPPLRKPATLMLRSIFLERKNQESRFFLSKSMPNFNFAET
jgi:hypothetical protein